MFTRISEGLEGNCLLVIISKGIDKSLSEWLSNHGDGSLPVNRYP
jgi:hypothetical protein